MENATAKLLAFGFFFLVLVVGLAAEYMLWNACLNGNVLACMFT